MPNRVLLVEDDASIRFGVALHLERHGFAVAQADSCASAREQFKVFDPSAVVTDYKLLDGDALDLISEFREKHPSLAIVVLTGYGSIELTVKALKRGADNLFTKPVDMDKLVEELRGACAFPRSHSGLRARIPVPRGSSAFDLEEQVERFKNVDCPLLIIGETGTGKTVLARRLHDAGRRHDKPFVDLNCAGLARDLVESELFGYERGAFTSANTSKPGMLELADGGTLFLDEIGDLDPAVQPKLLKAIEEKRFRRMGAVREIRVDVHVIAATHRDLRDAARANEFRPDLYYRLSTVTINVPALRERRWEIPSLARDLVTDLSSRLGRTEPELSAEAEAALVEHAWPGNVRELKNVLERALYLTPGPVLHAEDLNIEEPSGLSLRAPTARSSTLRDVERVHIEQALAQHGSVAEAARALGISRSSLYLKVKALGLLPGRGSVPKLKAGGG